MDRKTRKANFKKLQLPNTSTSRKLRSDRNGEVSAKISNYFDTPIKTINNEDSEANELECNADNVNAAGSVPVTENEHKEPPEKGKPTKRTKLTKFLYNNSAGISEDQAEAMDHIVPTKKRLTSNDFENIIKPVKVAPKLKTQSKPSKKSTRVAKKQQTIKSAFLRNEQLFSEITAQHCMAENFSPDEMQLALAISKSEAVRNQQHYEDDDDVVIDLVSDQQDMKLNESIRTKLQKYGFRTAAKEDYSGLATAFLPGANRRAKTKWANKFTPLTLRNPEYQLKKLQKQISIIMENHWVPMLNSDVMPPPPYQPLSQMLKKCASKARSSKVIQTEDDQPIVTKILAKFFVQDLFPISEVKAGYLLKNWKAIQGRDLSPKRPTAAAIKRAQKLKNVYNELEEFYEKLKTGTISTQESESTAKAIQRQGTTQNRLADESEAFRLSSSAPSPSGSMVVSSIDNDGETELNAMLELIKDIPATALQPQTPKKAIKSGSPTPVSTPLKEPPDKRTKLNDSPLKSHAIRFERLKENSKSQPNMPPCITIEPCTDQHESFELAKIATESLTATTVTQTRSTSPDLFASDSDEDMEKGAISTTAHGITTFEIYSSDEVKTTSAIELNMSVNSRDLIDNGNIPTFIVDLTQSEENSNETQDEPQTLAENCNASEDGEKVMQPKDCNTTHTLESKEMNNDCDLHITIIDSNSLDAAEKNGEVKEMDCHRINVVDFEEIEDNFDDEIDRDALEDLVNESVNQSFNKFADNDLLERSCLEKPKRTKADDSIFSILPANDTVFCSLASKYLKPAEILHVTQKKKSISMTQLDVSYVGATKPASKARLSSSFSKSDRSMTNERQPGVRLNKSVSFCESHEMYSKTASIDLTQHSSEEDDDNEPKLLLSDDDEINYSIWKANEPAQESSDEDLNIVDVESDKEDYLMDNMPDFKATLHRKKEQKSKQSLQRMNTDFNLDSDNEEVTIVFKDAVKTAQKTAHSLIKERAAFGIMESYSEPLGLSQLETLVEISPNEPESWQEASFMQSPSEKIIVKPNKRSSLKFQSFISEPMPQSGDTDIDEFDLMIFGSSKLTPSPLKPQTTTPCAKRRTRSKTPTGLEKLLTADISYNVCEPFAEPIHEDYEQYVPSYCVAAGINKSPAKPAQKPSSPVKPRKSTNNAAEPEEVTVNGHVYGVRITTDKKPDFTQQTEAELLKQLHKFGIKPLKRKQAIKMLEYIYNQTHPLLLQPAEEAITTTRTTAELANAEASDDNEDEEANEDTLNYSRELNSGRSVATAEEGSSVKLELHDTFGKDILRYVNQLFPALIDDEEYILQTNVTKKTPQPLLPLHIAWHNLLCSHIKLHESILLYKVIDLQEIYVFFKSIGYRYDPKDIRNFFDRRCIIFRYDLTPPQKKGEQVVRNPNVINRKKKK